MKKILIGVFFLIFFVSLTIILTNNKAISRWMTTAQEPPFANISSVGLKVKYKGEEFQAIMGVPVSMAIQLAEKYGRPYHIGEVPFYSLPTLNDFTKVAVDSNKALEDTIRWLIKKVDN